jgi:hypothetical protein
MKRHKISGVGGKPFPRNTYWEGTIQYNWPPYLPPYLFLWKEEIMFLSDEENESN